MSARTVAGTDGVAVDVAAAAAAAIDGRGDAFALFLCTCFGMLDFRFSLVLAARHANHSSFDIRDSKAAAWLTASTRSASEA